MKKFKGKLLTLEGPEGSGKSTQLALLYKHFKKKGRKVISFREPGSTETGEKIRRILLNDKDLKINFLSEMLLYQASRAQFVSQKLIPALKKGYLVLLDRFTDATLAYQGYGGGLDLKLIEKISKAVTREIEPDLTILLDIEPGKGLARVLKTNKKDRMEEKPLIFHKRMRKGYLLLARKKKRIKIIDASRGISETQAQIREVILNAIKQRII